MLQCVQLYTRILVWMPCCAFGACYAVALGQLLPLCFRMATPFSCTLVVTVLAVLHVPRCLATCVCLICLICMSLLPFLLCETLCFHCAAASRKKYVTLVKKRDYVATVHLDCSNLETDRAVHTQRANVHRKYQPLFWSQARQIGPTGQKVSAQTTRHRST